MKKDYIALGRAILLIGSVILVSAGIVFSRPDPAATGISVVALAVLASISAYI